MPLVAHHDQVGREVAGDVPDHLGRAAEAGVGLESWVSRHPMMAVSGRTWAKCGPELLGLLSLFPSCARRDRAAAGHLARGDCRSRQRLPSHVTMWAPPRAGSRPARAAPTRPPPRCPVGPVGPHHDPLNIFCLRLRADNPLRRATLSQRFVTGGAPGSRPRDGSGERQRDVPGSCRPRSRPSAGPR